MAGDTISFARGAPSADILPREAVREAAAVAFDRVVLVVELASLFLGKFGRGGEARREREGGDSAAQGQNQTHIHLLYSSRLTKPDFRSREKTSQDSRAKMG